MPDGRCTRKNKIYGMSAQQYPSTDTIALMGFAIKNRFQAK
jgi:hypothetical protein